MALQDISGSVRSGKQDNLKLHLFDLYNPEDETLTQKDRKDLLTRLYNAVQRQLTHTMLVESSIVYSDKDQDILFRKFLREGYEGAIIRRIDTHYECSVNDNHSNNVLKHKPIHTDEFKVIDYCEGTKGKDVGAVIFIMETNKCHRFNAVPNMKLKDRKHLFKDFKDTEVFKKFYNGKMATIQYASLSNKGIPQQCKYICIRDYE